MCVWVGGGLRRLVQLEFEWPAGQRLRECRTKVCRSASKRTKGCRTEGARSQDRRCGMQDRGCKNAGQRVRQEKEEQWSEGGGNKRGAGCTCRSGRSQISASLARPSRTASSCCRGRTSCCCRSASARTHPLLTGRAPLPTAQTQPPQSEQTLSPRGEGARVTQPGRFWKCRHTF